MTPKEKALELFYKMNDKVLLCQPKFFNSANIAKEIAIIAVNEIINDNPNIYDSDRLNYKYWNSVKQELKLL